MGTGMAYINLCNEQGFFTSGNNRQYSKCIKIAETLGFWQEETGGTNKFITLSLQLAAMTYICSDIEKFDYDYVESKVLSLFK